MHVPLAAIACAGEEELDEVQRSEPWDCLEDGPDIWDRVDTIGERLDGNVDGHVDNVNPRWANVGDARSGGSWESTCTELKVGCLVAR